jgi:NAD(P)H-dependent FMN reductase
MTHPSIGAATPASQSPNLHADLINVLVLVGLSSGPVSRAVGRHVIENSPDGVMVNVFGDLARLPRWNEALEARHTPDEVVELRTAASEADAVLVVTNYRARVPSMAHNAIDWLTRFQPRALLQKPIGVIGRSNGSCSGVWSRQIKHVCGGTEHRVIEPLTVPNLRAAITKLADEVRECSDR